MGSGEAASVRSRLYQLFSLGFTYPTTTFYQLLSSGEYRQQIKDLLEVLIQAGWEIPGASLQDLKLNSEELHLQRLCTEYVALFDVGQQAPPYPPYSGLYQDERQRPEVLLELTLFYRQFGLAPAVQPNELPDHFSLELEFMYFLSFREARALKQEQLDQVKVFHHAQRDFLDRHLGRWLPGFGKKIADKCQHPLYRPLTALIMAFVAADWQRLQHWEPGVDVDGLDH